MFIFHKKPDLEKDVQSVIDEFLHKDLCENELQWVNKYKLTNNCSQETAFKELSKKLDVYVRLKELEYDETVYNFIEMITDTECFAVHNEFEYIPSLKKDLKTFFQEIRIIMFDENNNDFYVEGLHFKENVLKLYKTFIKDIEDKLKFMLCNDYKDPLKRLSIGEECSKIWQSNSYNDPFLARINVVVKEV